jgi:hypothetical protein
MPAPRLGNQWPTAGERAAHCTWQYATPTTDTMGGRGEPTWTDFATWWAKALTVPSVQNEVQAVILYQVEGPYRADVMEYFTGGTGLRLVVNGLALKVFQVENPRLMNRTLIAHCANAVNTQ